MTMYNVPVLSPPSLFPARWTFTVRWAGCEPLQGDSVMPIRIRGGDQWLGREEAIVYKGGHKPPARNPEV